MVAPGELVGQRARGRLLDDDVLTVLANGADGEHVVRLVLPAHTIEGVANAEAALEVPLRVRPQTTSLAVWDVASPVGAGARFSV